MTRTELPISVTILTMPAFEVSSLVMQHLHDHVTSRRAGMDSDPYPNLSLAFSARHHDTVGVAIVDAEHVGIRLSAGRRDFLPLINTDPRVANMPGWVRQCPYVIAVATTANARCCAQQVAAMAQRIGQGLEDGRLPWGDPKKMRPPRRQHRARKSSFVRACA